MNKGGFLLDKFDNYSNMKEKFNLIFFIMLENKSSVNYCISGVTLRALYSDFNPNNTIISPKDFHAAVISFLSFNYHELRDSKLIYDASYDYEREAIKEVLLRIIARNDNFLKEVETGKRKKSKYIKPLVDNELWGDVIKGFFRDFSDVK